MKTFFLVTITKIRPKLGNSTQIRPVAKSPDLTVFPSLIITINIQWYINLVLIFQKYFWKYSTAYSYHYIDLYSTDLFNLIKKRIIKQERWFAFLVFWYLCFYGSTTDSSGHTFNLLLTYSGSQSLSLHQRWVLEYQPVFVNLRENNLISILSQVLNKSNLLM